MMPQASYPSSDIGKLQQEAMARMINMQQASSGGGWSTDPNVPRQNRAPQKKQTESTPPIPPKNPMPPRQDNGQQQNKNHNNFSNNRQNFKGRNNSQQHKQQNPSPEKPNKQKKSDTTLLQDILGAVGLDDDRVLILGLILILINSKADTTLILALCYLLL